VVSATDPHGRILGFLDRNRYYLLLQNWRSKESLGSVSPSSEKSGFIISVPNAS
jgi:hypothetical protein